MAVRWYQKVVAGIAAQKVHFGHMQPNAKAKGWVSIEFTNQLKEAFTNIRPARHAGKNIQNLKNLHGSGRHSGNAPWVDHG